MATDVTAAQFRARFPEFTVTDAVLEPVLEEACLIHSIRPLATLMCAAHLLTLEQTAASGGSTSGEVQSRTVGPLSVKYSVQAENGREAFFTSTRYGRRFLILESRSPRARIGAMVV